MLKRSLYFIVFVCALFAATGCTQVENLEVHLNEEVCLCIGQSASVVGEGLVISFEDVTEDSRCPSGVTCVWPGRVRCAVELRHAGSSDRMTLTEPGLTSGYTTEEYENYRLSFHVTPYPEAGEEIAKSAYRLHLIISKLPELTQIVGSILAEPLTFEGKDITVIGYYRGWDLLGEAGVGPPVTRSDWVIKDLSGAIYVSAHSEAKVPDGLSPDSLEDTDAVLKVMGIVRVSADGQPYIDAKSIERLS
ncbi:MAG: hypothetical protein ACUVWR_18740 [Anaerolineae bacterium]